MSCDNCGYDDYSYFKAKPKNKLMWLCLGCRKGLQGKEMVIVENVITRPLVKSRFVIPIVVALWTLSIAIALIVRF